MTLDRSREADRTVGKGRERKRKETVWKVGSWELWSVRENACTMMRMRPLLCASSLRRCSCQKKKERNVGTRYKKYGPTEEVPVPVAASTCKYQAARARIKYQITVRPRQVQKYQYVDVVVSPNSTQLFVNLGCWVRSFFLLVFVERAKKKNKAYVWISTIHT